MKASKEDAFTGFSSEALRFLRELRKNNDRAWFAPRKELYERELLAPLRALTLDVASALRKVKIPIDIDPSRVGFRIHRDVRFSHDKSPYKTNLGTYLPYRGRRDAPGGLYIHIAPKASFVAAAFYQLDKEPLRRWREEMAAEPKAFQAVLRRLEKSGAHVDEPEDLLKRMPRGFEAHAESPIAPYFKYSSFTVSEELPDEAVMDRRLVDRCVGLAKTAKPLLEYGWTLLG